MNPDQKRTFEKFKKGESLFITGPAGVGKSYLIKHIYNYCRNRNINIKVTALTGCASVLLNDCNAQTLHSFMNIGISLNINDVSNYIRKMKRQYRNKLKNLEVLIVDEVSMLHPKYFERMSKTLSIIRDNMNPMGGLQTLFFGDFYQLPCVNNNSDDKIYCFDSVKWRILFPPSNCINLHKNMRMMNDDNLSEMLNNIRLGIIKKEYIEALKKRVVSMDYINSMEIKPIRIVPLREQAERINIMELNKINSREVEFVAKINNKKAKFRRDIAIREAENIGKYAPYTVKLRLKIGATVMLIINIDRTLVNGSMGVIREFGINRETRLPKCLVQFENGRTVWIEYNTWLRKKENNNEPDFGVMQLPLILAYAITIHKIQGKTFDKVYADIGNNIFESGQAYVALSRIRNLNSLYLKDFNENKVFSCDRVSQFYKTIKHRKYDILLHRFANRMMNGLGM
jgi:ATP-dependent DNA helicase PIF1